jgi:NTP pyrophosphatase (non-canonical NTP hydrolase)
MVNELNLTDWAEEIYEANAAKGFWPKNPNDRNIGEALALVHSEVSEALEAHRSKKHFKGLGTEAEAAHMAKLKNFLTLGDAHAFEQYFLEYQKDTFEDELADVIIRILDLAGGLDIDIQSLVETKLAYNRMRSHKHGKQY